MAFNRYNVPMRRPLPKTMLMLALIAAGLTMLASAQGGVFSGNNGLIAYTCGANICTFDPVSLAKVPAFISGASDPTWSSDEDSIAYTNPAHEIVVADSDGTHPAVITAGPATQPTFSLDGIRVAYVKADNHIYSSFTNTGGGELQLTSGVTAIDADPAYSPDGSKIAYASSVSGGGYNIWTANADGSGSAVQLTSTAGDERSPTWSPTGGTIVYSAGLTHELFAFFGGTAHDLLVAGTDPAFSPDGTKIAFINGSGNLVTVPANVPTTAPTPAVLDSTAGNSQPDWQSVFVTPPPSTGGAPVNVSYPTVNLSFDDTAPTLGDFVSASIGTWSGAFPITYAYQWKRCEPADPVNGQCIDIANARSSFYTPVAADFGKRLRVQVTATNSVGSTKQNSEVTAPVTADAPFLRVTPQIVGSNFPVVDSVLVLSVGTWDGSNPLTYTYSWRRCNPAGDPASCVQIPGATLATYTPVVGDIGFSIRVWITGSNPAGSALAITNHTFPVVDKPHFSPSVSSTPTITGTMTIGRQLTASVGSFSGDEPVTTTFVWQRCDATGTGCHTIVGATKVVYHPTVLDLGSTLRIAVTAKNAFGTIVSMSDSSDPVVATPPHRRGRHIVGTQRAEYFGGGGFDDVILGMGGNDTILGGAGDDRLDGGSGKDVLTGGSGADRILGGAGSDTIYAADGERDVIDCGDGRDRAVVDSVDVVKNCEVVETQTDSSSGTTPPPVTPPGDNNGP